MVHSTGNDSSGVGPDDGIAPSAFVPLQDHSPEQKPGLNLVKIGVGVIAGIFILLMTYLFLARSVALTVVATAPVEMNIDGFGHVAFGQRHLMLSGDYHLRATATGYHPLETPFTVTDAESQSFDFTLRPLPGIVSIDTEPAGAAVWLDEEALGATPLQRLTVEPGEHSLNITAERYLDYTETITVEGREKEQSFRVSLLPAWAEVEVTTDPEGATILIDGEAVGTTPATVEVLQGEHQLLLQKPGFASHLVELEVEAGIPQAFNDIQLEPAAGLLSLTSRPSAANVTVDGEFRGQTPLDVELEPGSAHRVSLSKPGYRRATRVIDIPAGGSDSLNLALTAELGEIQLRVQPAGAVVQVNGRTVATGSTTLSLPAHEHSLVVSLEGHEGYRQRFTPRPGVAQVININLPTVADARRARIKPTVTTSLGQTLLLFEPSGTFTMGASRREPGRRANEVLHPVSLSRMFYLMTTEVSNEQFRQFQADHTSGQAQGNSLNREGQPAVNVSWQQAAQFCNWLSAKEGLPPFYRQSEGIVVGFNPGATGYRLPTEAEWSWAARVDGEALRKFTWGEEFPPKKVMENYADASSAYVTGRYLQGYKDGNVTTAAVGSFDPNHKGLFDMGGNVSEWVHDVYSVHTASERPLVDPLGQPSGDNYVIRGANWGHSRVSELRLTFRDYGQAGRDDVGFRIARFAE